MPADPSPQTTGGSTGKTRIIETEGGRFMPQFKPGLFWRWRFLVPHADAASTMRVILLEERDPAKAAQFSTEAEAKAFLDRFTARVDAYWRKAAEAEARARDGIQVKRVVS